ncbi:MAG: corrinoid protein [candidate division Zixibacteria bacterium]
MDLLENISLSLQRGEFDETAELTTQAVEQKLPPKQILDDGLIAGMKLVGEKFKCHDIFLPDVLLAAKAMNAGLDILKPLLIDEDMPSRGKVVLGTVQGDLHDLGKNLVGIMLKGAGFDVIDLGNDVSPQKFVETALEKNAPVIGLSALLTTTMPVMKSVVDLIKEKGLDGKIKVAIGGAPVTQQFADEIGADAYGFDGINAVECVDRLIS